MRAPPTRGHRARLHTPCESAAGGDAHRRFAFYKDKHPANCSTDRGRSLRVHADRGVPVFTVHVHDLEVASVNSHGVRATITAASAPLVSNGFMAEEPKTKQATLPDQGNMLRQIVSLFNFARRQKYVPRNSPLKSRRFPRQKQPAPIASIL